MNLHIRHPDDFPQDLLTVWLAAKGYVAASKDPDMRRSVQRHLEGLGVVERGKIVEHAIEKGNLASSPAEEFRSWVEKDLGISLS